MINFSQYIISEEGVVYNTRTGRTLKQTLNSNGYLYVTLSNGKLRKKVYIHRWLAKEYLPNPRNLPEVNHIDGNKTNNCISNLEWVTYSDNLTHAYSTHLRGTSSKITPAQIKEIKERYKPRCPVNGTRALGREFGVTNATISNLLRGKRKYEGV